VRTLLTRDFEEAFKKVDAIVTPTCPTAAFKLGEKVDDPLAMYLADIYTVTANLAGIPGISVPLRTDQRKATDRNADFWEAFRRSNNPALSPRLRKSHVENSRPFRLRSGQAPGCPSKRSERLLFPSPPHALFSDLHQNSSIGKIFADFVSNLKVARSPVPFSSQIFSVSMSESESWPAPTISSNSGLIFFLTPDRLGPVPPPSSFCPHHRRSNTAKSSSNSSNTPSQPLDIAGLDLPNIERRRYARTNIKYRSLRLSGVGDHSSIAARILSEVLRASVAIASVLPSPTSHCLSANGNCAADQPRSLPASNRRR